MSVPQVKDGPASALRAIFGGIGSLLRVVDKVRAKPAAEPPAGTKPPAPVTPSPESTAPAAAAPAATAAPETVTPEATAPEPAAAAEPETVAKPAAAAGPETAADPAAAAGPETVAKPAAAAGPETTGALPLPNYDELTVASLRARLRNLSVEQLNQLIRYEQGHAARADVIAMFERRIAKIESEA